MEATESSAREVTVMSGRTDRKAARGNPLQRRSDKIQTLLACLMLAVVIVGAPMAALSAGLTRYHTVLHTAQTQAADRHLVTAHLQTNAGSTTPQNTLDFTPVPVTTAWTAADGTIHTATVAAQPDEAADTATHVWVDSHGAATSALVSGTEASLDAWQTGGLAAMAATAVGLTSGKARCSS
jgi:hypothetical protein